VHGSRASSPSGGNPVNPFFGNNNQPSGAQSRKSSVHSEIEFRKSEAPVGKDEVEEFEDVND
jgi:hypothetical protein